MPSPRLHAACWSALLLLGGTARAQSLTVLSPEIGEPYRAVFAEIIQGIEEQSQARVHGIALGRQGLKAADTLDPAIGVVLGGVGAAPEGGHSGQLSWHQPDAGSGAAVRPAEEPAAGRASCDRGL